MSIWPATAPTTPIYFTPIGPITTNITNTNKVPITQKEMDLIRSFWRIVSSELYLGVNDDAGKITITGNTNIVFKVWPEIAKRLYARPDIVINLMQLVKHNRNFPFISSAIWWHDSQLPQDLYENNVELDIWFINLGIEDVKPYKILSQ